MNILHAIGNALATAGSMGWQILWPLVLGFTLSGVNVLSTLIPTASIWGVGFAWKDYETLWRALDGKLGASLRAQITKAGLIPLEKIWDNGFRQITTSTRPIGKPEDLKGMKIRVPINALWTSLFESLGVSVSPPPPSGAAWN